MSTAEVANPVDSNSQSAQDVQNMLAELKGSRQTGTATDPTAVDKDEIAQASDNKENVDESKSKVSAEENGVDDPEIKMNGEAEEEKKDGEEKKDDAEKKDEAIGGETGEGSQGHRPHHGGYKGREGARDRGDFKSYKQNIKSDLIAQEETDDPVQIRKQVGLLLLWSHCGALTRNVFRLNSTSPTPTFLWTDSSSHKLAVARISRSISKLFTRSSACAISSLSPPLLLL